MHKISLGLITVAMGILLSSWVAIVQPNRPTPIAYAMSLARVDVTSDRPATGNTTYSFTLILPGQQGTQFSKLSFTEQYRDQGTDSLQFDILQPAVFLGTPEAMGQRLDAAGWVDETGTFWIELHTPVAAGTTLTVALEADNRPSSAMYDYGIAAYPDNGRPAIYVGDGTLRTR